VDPISFTIEGVQTTLPSRATVHIDPPCRGRELRTSERASVAVVTPFFQKWAFPMRDDLLQIEISPPKSRGMKLRFSSGSQQFEDDITTSVFPFLEQLCDALRVLHDGYIDEKIRLLIGAPECDLHLQAAARSSQAALSLIFWPDHKRCALSPERSVFRFEGERQEIVSPFIAALKSLRLRISDANFEREYGAPFPAAEYARLMQRAQ
jgi:hypothetical protein